MNIDINCIFAIILFVAVLISVPVLRISGGNSKTNSQTETGYLIRRRRDGYPLFVNGETVRKALRTGDYTFTEDETRDIPVGQQYTDKRLN